MGKLVVADADAFIALALEHDPHHQKAVALNTLFIQQEVTVVFPLTVFPEAITTLKRAFNQPEKAHSINKQYQQGAFHVVYITEDIMKRASQIFERAVSKKNTLFDAIVAATAESLETKIIFSFDQWYKKLGLTLAVDLLEAKKYLKTPLRHDFIRIKCQIQGKIAQNWGYYYIF